MPDDTAVYLTTPDGIAGFSISETTGRASLIAEATLGAVHGLTRAPGGFYCAVEDELLRIGHDLTPIARCKVGDIGAIAHLPPDRLLASVDGSLLVLDAFLQQIGRLELTAAGKNAHDFLLRGTHLYALDNVIFPALLWIIDLSDEAHPAVVHEGEVEDIHPHLVAQLVEPGTGLWLVFQSGVGQPSSWQNVHVLRAADGRRLQAAMIHCRRWMPDFSTGKLFQPASPPSGSDFLVAHLAERTSEGQRSGLAVTWMNGAVGGWAVLEDEHGDRYVGELRVEQGGLWARSLHVTPDARAVTPAGSFLCILCETGSSLNLQLVSQADGLICYEHELPGLVPDPFADRKWTPAIVAVERNSDG
jgi:hypothetical protein